MIKKLLLLALLTGQPALEIRADAQPPRLAIIIDDVGYDLKRETELIHFDFPLTLSILPDFNSSRKLATLAKASGKEVMLHMSMESTTGFPVGDIGLTLSMSPQQRQQALELALSEVPHAVGVSNHMGSKLTSDRKTMDWFMSELASRQLYFIDSLTSPNSAANSAARDAGLSWGVRNVFLDNQKTDEYLEQQLQQAIAIAKKRGQSILIGHPYPETIAFLKRRIPILLDFGEVELVSVSEVITPGAWTAAAAEQQSLTNQE